MPPHVLEIGVEPRTVADKDKLKIALQNLAAEDSSFAFSFDEESGQACLKGVSELHLDAKAHAMRQIYGVNALIGAPQVAYRETLGRAADIDYTHKKQSGGTGQYARVKLTFEPLPPGSGFVFESAIVGGSVPKEFIPGVEKGLKSVMNSGPLAGFPVIDFKVTLTDGAYHDVDSSVLAFEIAARAAFREASERVQMKLLEPIMKVEVVSPEDYVGTVIGDLNSRRGMIQGQEMRGYDTVVIAVAPLANMLGYGDALARSTDGRASFTMRFARYDPVHGSDRPDDFPPAIGMRA